MREEVKTKLILQRFSGLCGHLTVIQEDVNEQLMATTTHLVPF